MGYALPLALEAHRGRPRAERAVHPSSQYSVQYFLVPGTGTVYVDAGLSIIRRRAVGQGFHEDLEILNHKAQPLDPDIRIDAAADFADFFEIKDALAKKGEQFARGGPGRLVLGFRRGQYLRETWITARPRWLSTSKASISRCIWSRMASGKAALMSSLQSMGLASRIKRSTTSMVRTSRTQTWRWAWTSGLGRHPP